MASGELEWLPLEEAAISFGYTHHESLRRRLRQLRGRGLVVDIGNPPVRYKVRQGQTKGKIIIYWPNPKVALLRSDAPLELLNPKQGKRKID